MVDRNGFTLDAVHPIIVIYSKPNSSYENIEEHHFRRTEAYPESKIQLRSIKAPDREYELISVSLNLLYHNIISRVLSIIKHANVKINTVLKSYLHLDDPERLLQYLSITYYPFK